MTTLALDEVSSTTKLEDMVFLGHFLANHGYSFTTVGPSTHRRIIARSDGCLGSSLRDIFGWNLPFAVGVVPDAMLSRMWRSGLVVERDGNMRSTVRFSSIDNRLYIHDAYPTLTTDAVFFGPDTYRFVQAIRTYLRPCDLLVDVCCGSGAGGLEAGIALAQRVLLADINPRAIACAEANRLLAHHFLSVVHEADLFAGVDERPEAIIANPPYLADPLGRTYRDGSGVMGMGLSVRIVREALDLLAPGGQLLLYTGSPIVKGIDCFTAAILPLVQSANAHAVYQEIDPDVCGDELEHAAYESVERIAVVVLSVTMPSA